MTVPAPAPAALKRSLSLGQATLYGLGVTIGAGIYVMVGAAALRAGMHAPLSFLLAAGLMGCTAASFAELATRMPVAAGEAAYVRRAFPASGLGTAVGMLVVAIAVVSAAAVAVGCAGYITVFLPLPEKALAAAVVVLMGAVAAARVNEAVTAAGVMTVIEIGGLLILLTAAILGSRGAGTELVTRLPEITPHSTAALAGILAAVPLAVFAFIGFEGLANIAEEVRDPQRTLPKAIFLTLVLSTLLYLAVLWVSLTSVPLSDLANAKAPLSLVFGKLTGLSPHTMTAIAIVATLNGIIVQIIMASRVLYGLAEQGALPAALARVSPVTNAPLFATALATAAILALAVSLPLGRLADITSHLTLVVFALVNLSLARLKRRDDHAEGFAVPSWVPWAGFASCAAVLVAELARLLVG